VPYKPTRLRAYTSAVSAAGQAATTRRPEPGSTLRRPPGAAGPAASGSPVNGGTAPLDADPIDHEQCRKLHRPSHDLQQVDSTGPGHIGSSNEPRSLLTGGRSSLWGDDSRVSIAAFAGGPQAEANSLRSFGSNGFHMTEHDDQDIRRMAELVEAYLDLPLGIVDPAVVAITERAEAHRDREAGSPAFRIVQPNHTQA
jgi:hypothetical protein